MGTTDPILAAIARLEERLVERLDERFGEWRRNLLLDLDGRFDAVSRRLDRLEQEYGAPAAELTHCQQAGTAAGIPAARGRRPSRPDRKFKSPEPIRARSERPCSPASGARARRLNSRL